MMALPERKKRHVRSESRLSSISLRGIGRYWIVCAQGAGQIKIRGAMVKALRQWLDSHELPAIITAVLGVVIALAVLIVVGGYLVVAP
jgi:hypothetical protein